MIIESAGKNYLESMFKILEKCGNKWPPYPQEFEIPDGMKSVWEYKNFNCLDSITLMPILRGNFNVYNGLHIEDKFNGVVIQKKRQKGLNSSKRFHRTPQFIFPPYKLSGEIVFDNSLSGTETIGQGELRKGEVHRFEIISIDFKKGVFYCVPLKHTFTKDNLLYNLVNCNYQPSSRKS